MLFSPGRASYLYVPFQLLQQGGVLLKPHEGLAQARGQRENGRAAGTLALHEALQLLTAERTGAQTGRLGSSREQGGGGWNGSPPVCPSYNKDTKSH